MKKAILIMLAAGFSLALYLTPVNSSAEWGIKDKWDGNFGYCHGDPVDCWGEIIINPQ